MRFFAWMFETLRAWVNESAPDTYVPIAVKPQIDPDTVNIPESLLGPDVPVVGQDQEDVLRKAMRVSENHEVRIRYLNAIKHLRTNSNIGWSLDKGSKKPNWGVSDTRASQALNQPTLPPSPEATTLILVGKSAKMC